jgi:hypothetical protein
MYSLYIPFFGIALVIALLIGDGILKLSIKCAGVPAGTGNEKQEPSESEHTGTS